MFRLFDYVRLAFQLAARGPQSETACNQAREII
jgi:hypothetical protein